MNFEKEASFKPQIGNAEGLEEQNGPEEEVFFVFVCRGPVSAYKQIETFVKGKTLARVIFQRRSKFYLRVSEVRLKPLK